jgi:Putative auto-transporter adhesin, head GIN domain
MNAMQPIRRLFTAALLTVSATALAGFSPAALAWGWGKTVTGSGTPKTESRNVTDFTGVGVSIPAKVTIIQGDKEGVTLEGDDNILAVIETEVERGSLKLRFNERGMNVKTKTPLRVTVHAKTVDHLSVAGSGDILSDAIKSDTFKASIAGSGDINLKKLTAENVRASISGSGNFSAGGKAANVEVSIAGSGDVKVGTLESDKVKISIAGSGDATVWAKQNLSMSVAGSGDVKYYGNPEVKKSIAGSGSSKKLGDAPTS